jgi:DNA-binding FadR family transcriptional regulator
MDRSDQSSGRAERRYVEVAQGVLSALARGEFAVGERLPPDRDLAVRFGVSRPVAREALLVLELIGVVDIRHGDGVYVLGPPARIGSSEGPALDVQPRELIEGRRVLEPGVCSFAAARMSAADIERIGQDIEEMAGIVDDLDQLPRFTQLGLQFHSDLAIGCGNSMLSGLVHQLVDTERHPLWALINQHAMSSTAARRGQVKEHRAILQAVIARDPELAASEMRGHLQQLESAIFRPPGS